MRLLVGLSILALAACSGASSSDLFGAPPLAIEDPSSTEPSPPPANDDEPLSPRDPPHDAGVEPRDASLDAKADAPSDAPSDVVVLDASLPEKCSFDSECIDGEVCNWQTDTCAVLGAIGAPCKRDLECAAALCNWKLTTCSEPAPAGTPCRRHKECASGTCISSGSICK